jgi:hypothetical protein
MSGCLVSCSDRLVVGIACDLFQMLIVEPIRFRDHLFVEAAVACLVSANE